MNCELGYVEPPASHSWPNKNAVKRPVVEPWQVRHKNGIKDWSISRNESKSLREFYCTVLRNIATVLSLIDSLGGAVCKLPNMRSCIPLRKKYDIVVSFNSVNGRKVVNLQKISMFQRRWVVSKNKDKIFSHIFLSKCTVVREKNTVRGNLNQRTLLTFTRLWHWTKKPF